MFDKIKIFLALLVSVLYPTLLSAGISGTLSGTVLDQETGNTLPGASILVEGTTMGAMADRNGYFIIYNLPAGNYNISVSMIGYTKLTIKNVKINIDLNTSLKIFLSAEVLPLNEVIITEEKQLIKSEITSSTYFISGV